MASMRLPLRGIKVIEFAGLAPAPFCGKLLADFGADVIRVDKVKEKNFIDCLAHGKRSIAVDLKHKDGRSALQRLSMGADVLIDPFRPGLPNCKPAPKLTGVLEKAMLGPDQLMSVNPRLVYARLTGYGQTGPLADRAGHDINFLGLSGALSALGRHPHPPTPPVNLLADFAGGGLLAAFGVLLALMDRHQTGKGQLVDNSLTEGAAYVSSWLWASRHLPMIWGNVRGHNPLDGGQHYYQVYRTADDRFMSVGALEPKFYDALLQGLGLTHNEVPQQTENPEKSKELLASVFASKTQQEWTDIFTRLDACVEPVLDFDEAAEHPHHKVGIPLKFSDNQDSKMMKLNV